METKVAIMTMNDGIRTLSGITFFKREMMALDISSTKVVAKPIPRAFFTEVVTAKVGQVPNTSTRTGFSLKNPLVKI